MVVVGDRLLKVPVVVVARAEVAVCSRLLHLVGQPLRDAQVVHVALDGVVEVAHGQVDGPHVADLTGLLQLVAQALHQGHALLVARQGVGVVILRRIDVT